MKLQSLTNEEIIEIVKKHKIEYRNSLNGINIPFGCEIEFEEISFYAVLKKLNDFKNSNFNLLPWKLKEDDSLDPLFDRTSFSPSLSGGEIISPILNNSLQDWNNLKDICLFLRNINAKALDLSAAHIHFDNKLFKDNYIALKRLLELWSIYEDVIFRFSAGFKDKVREYAITYAVPVSNRIFNVINNTSNYDELLNSFRTPRTNAISLYNFDKKINDSFEFRCPNGTLSEVVWQNNINFFKHLLEVSLDNNKEWDKIDYMLAIYNPNEYIFELYNGLNINKACTLADFIFDQDCDKKSFMKQYIKR